MRGSASVGEKQLPHSPRCVARFNEAQRKRFDGLYDRFLVELAPDVVERMERIVAAPRIAPGEVVPDVGTGTGALLPLIRSFRPGSVIACDLSGRMLAQVAKRFPDVVRHQCDVRDLSLPDASVDVGNGMYGNIADKPGALRNITRMIRPSGRVVISHPEGRAFVAGIARTEPFPITPLPSEDEARSFLSSFGLRLQRYVDEERLLIALAALADEAAR